MKDPKKVKKFCKFRCFWKIYFSQSTESPDINPLSQMQKDLQMFFL